MRILHTIYLFLVSISSFAKADDEPPRLNKPQSKKQLNLNLNLTEVLLIIFMIVIFIMIMAIVYKTGSLESTQYYYRLR